MRSAITLWLAAGAFALAACSSCSSGSSKGNPAESTDGGGHDAAVEAGPSADQACNDFATAACGRLQACAPFLVQLAYGDATTCAQRSALGCTPSLTASGSKVTPAQMESCAQAISAETCDESLDNAQPSACANLGTLAAGTACGAHSQCQSGYCKNAVGTVCGTCTARAAAGAACTVDEDCTAGLLCNQSACIAPAASKAPCSMTQPCTRSLTCIAGTCQTPLAVGAACSAATDCDGAQGAYCNTQTKMCAQTQLAATGQPCGIVNSTVVACSGGDTCVNVMGTQGTCHPPAADGALCGPGVACMSPSVCVSGKCTLPDASTCH